MMQDARGNGVGLGEPAEVAGEALNERCSEPHRAEMEETTVGRDDRFTHVPTGIRAKIILRHSSLLLCSNEIPNGDAPANAPKRSWLGGLLRPAAGLAFAALLGLGLGGIISPFAVANGESVDTEIVALAIGDVPEVDQ